MRHLAVLATCNSRVEYPCNLIGGGARNVHAIVPELRLPVVRKQEVEGRIPLGQIVHGNLIHRVFKLKIEVVHSELVEVAEHDASRPLRHQIEPVVEGLAIVALELLIAFLHLQQKPWSPQQVGEPSALALLPYPILQGRTGFLVPLVPESLEEAIAEHLRLPFLVTFEASRILYESFKVFDCLAG